MIGSQKCQQNAPSFACSSDCLQRKILELAHLFFLMFYMKWDSQKKEKLGSPNFRKKSLQVKRVQKVSKMA